MARIGNLSASQRRAVAAVMATRTTVAAAEKAEVGLRTLHRWLADPAFQAALTEAEAELQTVATRQLLNGTMAALGVVDTIMTGDGPPGVRLRAATTWLDQARTWFETKTLEARLQALEAEVLRDSEGKG